MKRRIRLTEELRQEKEQFCTECGEKLENFCFSKEADDMGAIRSRHEACKKKNRFKGDTCSRLFIARKIDSLPPDEY